MRKLHECIKIHPRLHTTRPNQSDSNNERRTSVIIEVIVEVKTMVLADQQVVDGVGLGETRLVTTVELLRAGQSVTEDGQDVTVYHW